MAPTETTYPTIESRDSLLLQASLGSPYDEAKELQSVGARAHLCFVLMQVQAQPRESVLQRAEVFSESAFVITKEDQVVRLPDVAWYAQLFFDEMVNRVQQHVGKELTGQVADR